MNFAYDITLTWEENCERGPKLPPLRNVPTTPYKQFLGLPVRSRLGISAGLLANSRWVIPFAQRGFDLLTYKTVRSTARPSYPLPNWVWVDDSSPGITRVIEKPPADPRKISSAVCFGMPSFSPEYWRADIRKTVQQLAPGQILITSVVGTPGQSPSIESLADDYCLCADWAIQAGAHAIEANISCPNVCSREGSLYTDLPAVRTLVQRLRQTLGSTPLLLKIGTFPSLPTFREFLQCVDGIASGITFVNCLQREILRFDGTPVFGPPHRIAGILGRAIHEPTVADVRAAKKIIEADRLGLIIAAVGGVSMVQDIQDFYNAGADAVLCGSSPMYLPDLAIEAKHDHPEW